MGATIELLHELWETETPNDGAAAVAVPLAQTSGGVVNAVENLWTSWFTTGDGMHLQQLFEQLAVPLDPALLQCSNSSGGSIASTPALSADALDQLQSFYAEDFRRFGYSLESPGLDQ